MASPKKPPRTAPRIVLTSGPELLEIAGAAVGDGVSVTATALLALTDADVNVALDIDDEVDDAVVVVETAEDVDEVSTERILA
jgi:hypothetical protein